MSRRIHRIGPVTGPIPTVRHIQADEKPQTQTHRHLEKAALTDNIDRSQQAPNLRFSWTEDSDYETLLTLTNSWYGEETKIREIRWKKRLQQRKRRQSKQQKFYGKDT